MEILKVVEELEAHCTDERGIVKDDGLSTAMAAAAALLVGQGEKIADLERTVIHQRKRASDAEDFICMLCTECDWERDGDVIIMSKHCCEFGMPECGKFKLRGTDPGRWIPVTERVPEPEKRVLILTTVKHCTGKLFQEIMCGFYEDGNVWCEDSKATWDNEMKRKENYDENRDDYRVPEGWYEELLNDIDDYNCVQIGDTVTHWMPLPEPPKEEAV